ncbi:MAG: 30S ribosomal protein S1 [Campylobacter sp.]|uniref:30S ribosomal protein S1 n=1 Tax=Campylobacter sp. TaxID=205 RepID=UPI00297147B6|nr:30S ribosomal protein S1 [Campylobacter sp.]MDD7600544.1 30S ribosomal protein S1 [Campylobacteraceae bacterium]MDY5887651.1 30S ribosomal protein S1 [Campylobacter sp.]
MAVQKHQIHETDEDFATLLEESFKKESNGSLCEGEIVNIKDNEVLVDVHKKSDGVMDISEITANDGSLKYKIGDKIEVLITGSRGGRPIVSHKKALAKSKVADFIAKYDENAENVFEVKIASKNKGGYVAYDENGVEFFIPRSQMREANVGTLTKVKVIKVDAEENSIVASKRRMSDASRKERKEALEQIAARTGEVVTGVIKKITSYGMFVDVGGADGLVHYKEISYKGPINPASLYKEGDSVDVKIISYDKDKKHLSLSIKAAQPDPWSEIKEGLSVGDAIRVTVSNIEPYGAFVDLGNDVEGFLHISEISWDKNISNPKDFIKEGESIDVEVIEINHDTRRLRVSLKNLLAKPFDEFKAEHKVGDILKGEIVSTTEFGAFVKIPTKSSFVEGLLHNEDASWDRGKRCKDFLKVGEKIEVKLIKIDNKAGKISLSLKELQDSPIADFASKHKVGDKVTGSIKDVKGFGAFVELVGGVEALIRKEDATDELSVGASIEAAIADIDKSKARIRLSQKKLRVQKEREALDKFNAASDDKITIGDIIKEQLN